MTRETTPTPTSASLLSDEMLERFGERAPGYDRENRFFSEDFEELKEAGYLTLAVPRSSAAGAAAGRGLPRAAPSGLPRAGHRAGHQHAPLLDRRRRRPLPAGRQVARVDAREAGEGEVFAAGHGERGQRPAAALLHGQCRAGRRRLPIHRPQVFGSLTPGLDPPRDPRHGHERPREPEGRPRLHAARHRTATASTRRWDTLGMRATRSDDTVLEGAFVPDNTSRGSCPPASRAPTSFVLAIFAWALTLRQHLPRAGPARARSGGRPASRTRPRSRMTRSMAYHPEVQHAVAEMVLALEARAASGAGSPRTGRGRRPRRPWPTRSSAPSTGGRERRRRWSTWRSRWRAAPACSSAASSSGYSATRAWVGSTRRTAS